MEKVFYVAESAKNFRSVSSGIRQEFRILSSGIRQEFRKCQYSPVFLFPKFLANTATHILLPNCIHASLEEGFAGLHLYFQSPV